MKRLRFWIAILSMWLMFFFNIERILLKTELNLIQSYTYIFVALVLVATLSLSKIRTGIFIFLVTFLVFLFLALWYNQPFWRRFPTFAVNQVTTITALTILQVCAIILTGFLARQVSKSVREFEDVIANITFNYIGIRPKPFLEVQDVLYQELKRARYYQRPLSIVALQVDNETIQTNLSQMVQQVQKGMMKEYMMARIARILDDELQGFNTLALRDDCFIVAMPEIDAAEIAGTMQNLEKTLKEKANIAVNIGMASFPDEAVTFETLVEQAVENIDRPQTVLAAAVQEAPLKSSEQPTVMQEIS